MAKACPCSSTSSLGKQFSWEVNFTVADWCQNFGLLFSQNLLAATAPIVYASEIRGSLLTRKVVYYPLYMNNSGVSGGFSGGRELFSNLVVVLVVLLAVFSVATCNF